MEKWAENASVSDHQRNMWDGIMQWIFGLLQKRNHHHTLFHLCVFKGKFSFDFPPDAMLSDFSWKDFFYVE